MLCHAGTQCSHRPQADQRAGGAQDVPTRYSPRQQRSGQDDGTEARPPMAGLETLPRVLRLFQRIRITPRPPSPNSRGDAQMAPHPSPAFSVREATTADAPTIADLAIGLGYHIGVDEVRQRLAALPATHVVFVATNRERVVGWLHAFHGHSVLHGDRVEIAGLAVATNRQSQGVGTALITHLERWTLQRGVHTIRLLSGSERTAAHHFYRNRGYRHLKTEQAFIKTLLPG
jgi:GNAT superfamily N-acetyltransferase